MFKLEFETGNDAFQKNGMATEIQAILERVIYDVTRDGMSSGNIRDTNGNTVGKWELTED